MNIAQYIDHTLLKPATTINEVNTLCDEAVSYSFFAVCVPPPLVATARARLRQSNVKVATVIGFPFGYSLAQAKLEEVKNAIEQGAHELDVVINLILLRQGDITGLEAEMRPLVEAAHAANRLVKVIIESGILSPEEIVQCCELYAKMDVDFLKTSTGYAEKGATVEAVQLMRQTLPSTIKIKASGGIRTYDQAMQMINAGADRLGCSASVAIVKESRLRVQKR